MKIRRKHRFAAEVSTSSLNDIMFFLLLFFLIISTVANPNVIKVLLPKAEAQQAVTKKPVPITVTEDKHYYLEKREVSLDVLENELKTYFAGVNEPTVVLRLHPSLTVQDLVDLMQIGLRLNIKMVLATQK